MGFRVTTALLFQSTLPCGSDLYVKVIKQLCKYFNPRSLAGATLRKCEAIVPAGISIHAPLRERLIS